MEIGLEALGHHRSVQLEQLRALNRQLTTEVAMLEEEVVALKKVVFISLLDPTGIKICSSCSWRKGCPDGADFG